MAPASRAAAVRVKLLESEICPGPIGSPGSTSSLPVESTTTRGRGRTRTVPRPIAASSPSWVGPSSVPAVRTSSPALMSLPRRRMWAPSATGRRTRTSSFSTGAPMLSAARPVPEPPSVHSTGATASAPGGMGAPVMIRAAWPGPTLGRSPAPAAMSPITASTEGYCSVAPVVSVVRRA